jgi:hypothetical protein
MSEERRWTTFGAAQTFENAAHEAEIAGNYGLAATLYRAVLLVLTGKSLDDVHVLTHAGCNASLYGELPRCGSLSHTSERFPSSDEGLQPGVLSRSAAISARAVAGERVNARGRR